MNCEIIAEICSHCNYQTRINLLQSCKEYYYSDSLKLYLSKIKLDKSNNISDRLYLYILSDDDDKVDTILQNEDFDKFDIDDIDDIENNEDFDKFDIDDIDDIENNVKHHHIFKYALKNGAFKVVKLLVDKYNINPNLKDDIVINMICEYGYLDIGNFLLSNKKFKISNQYYALKIACEYNRPSILKILLDNFIITPKRKDLEFYIPFLHVVEKNYEEIFEILINDDKIDLTSIGSDRLYELIQHASQHILNMILNYPDMDRPDLFSWAYSFNKLDNESLLIYIKKYNLHENTNFIIEIIQDGNPEMIKFFVDNELFQNKNLYDINFMNRIIWILRDIKKDNLLKILPILLHTSKANHLYDDNLLLKETVKNKQLIIINFILDDERTKISPFDYELIYDMININYDYFKRLINHQNDFAILRKILKNGNIDLFKIFIKYSTYQIDLDLIQFCHPKIRKLLLEVIGIQ